MVSVIQGLRRSIQATAASSFPPRGSPDLENGTRSNALNQRSSESFRESLVRGNLAHSGSAPSNGSHLRLDDSTSSAGRSEHSAIIVPPVDRLNTSLADESVNESRASDAGSTSTNDMTQYTVGSTTTEENNATGRSLLSQVALTNDAMESALTSHGSESLHETTQNILLQEVGCLVMLSLAIFGSRSD